MIHALGGEVQRNLVAHFLAEAFNESLAGQVNDAPNGCDLFPCATLGVAEVLPVDEVGKGLFVVNLLHWLRGGLCIGRPGGVVVLADLGALGHLDVAHVGHVSSPGCAATTQQVVQHALTHGRAECMLLKVVIETAFEHVGGHTAYGIFILEPALYVCLGGFGEQRGLKRLDVAPQHIEAAGILLTGAAFVLVALDDALGALRPFFDLALIGGDDRYPLCDYFVPGCAGKNRVHLDKHYRSSSRGQNHVQAGRESTREGVPPGIDDSRKYQRVCRAGGRIIVEAGCAGNGR